LRVSTPTRPPRATMTPCLPQEWGQTSQLVSWLGGSGAPATCVGVESSGARRVGRVSVPPAEGRFRHENCCRPHRRRQSDRRRCRCRHYHLHQSSRSPAPLNFCFLFDIISHRGRPVTFGGPPPASALPAGVPPRQRRGRAQQSRHVGHGRMCGGFSAWQRHSSGNSCQVLCISGGSGSDCPPRG